MACSTHHSGTHTVHIFTVQDLILFCTFTAWTYPSLLHACGAFWSQIIVYVILMLELLASSVLHYTNEVEPGQTLICLHAIRW